MVTAPNRLKRRADFLRVARAGRKAVARGVVMQAAPGTGDRIGLGFTVTRRVGNAVVRNRVRRRLKAAAAIVMPEAAAPGFDYVLIGRAATLDRPFASLVGDLNSALRRLNCLRSPNPPDSRQENGIMRDKPQPEIRAAGAEKTTKP